MGEGEMRVVPLEGAHEVGDVQATKEGGKSAAICQAFEVKPLRMGT
jgi:hypothetical protein